jgi:hypothetical protein
VNPLAFEFVTDPNNGNAEFALLVLNVSRFPVTCFAALVVVPMKYPVVFTDVTF